MASFATFTGVTAATPTTAAPVAVATINGVKTILQLATPANVALTVWKWGINFDGTGTTPIKVEVFTHAVAATVTAGVGTNVGPMETALTSAATFSTTGTGYNASAEGTVVAPLRFVDLQQILPGNYFQNEFSLGREIYVPPSSFLRIRVTDTAAHNCYAFACWDE